jgi:hypothetical protein
MLQRYFIFSNGRSKRLYLYSLYSNTTGNYNTTLGDNSGAQSSANDTVFNKNSYLGASSGNSADNLTNATAIGYNSKVGASNTLILGGTGADAVNVGIGTTTSQSMLTVASGINALSLHTNIGTHVMGLGFNRDVRTGAIFNSAKYGYQISDYSDRLQFEVWQPNGVAVNSSALAIDSLGNVGINTINPIDKLHIKGFDSRDISFSPGSVTPAINFTHNDNGNVNARWASIAAHLRDGGTGKNGGDLYFSTAPSTVGNPAVVERMRIMANGFVGIGTTTPTSKLEIAGDIKITDGTQGVGKVLTSDATGKASWLSSGSKFFQSSAGLSTSSTIVGSYVYCNNSINIPEAGTYLLFTTAHIANFAATESWFNVNYSTSNTIYTTYPSFPASCADMIEATVGNRNFTNINVITVASPTTLYQWVRANSSNNWIASGNGVDGESTIIAIKLN